MCLLMCLILVVLIVVLIGVYFMGVLMGFLIEVIYTFYNQIIQIILQYMDYKGLILGQIKYILY